MLELHRREKQHYSGGKKGNDESAKAGKAEDQARKRRFNQGGEIAPGEIISSPFRGTRSYGKT